MKRITRTAPVVAAAVSDALTTRRSRLRQVREEKVTSIRESDDQIIPCPTDFGLLSAILDRVPREKREHRPGNHLHVSDLLKHCVRKLAIVKKHGIPVRHERLSMWDEIAFRQGDALHDLVRERTGLAADDMIWGKWKCKCGHLYHDEPCTLSEIDPDDICPHCGTPTDNYGEVSMRDDDLMLVGNPDLLLYFRDYDAYHVNEIKSLAHNHWEEIARPQPEHVLQVLLYWYLMRKLGYRLTDMVSIIYVSKGYLFNSTKPYKEFMIYPAEHLHRIDPYLEDARLLKLSRTSSKLPVRLACKTIDSTKARKCEACDICFASD